MSDFSSVYTAIEIADMRSTIDDIQKILQTIPFDEDTARQKVYEINAKHPDNKMIWNLLHANVPSGVSIQQASKENLYQDLQWKHIISKRKSLESPLMKCERIYRISERTYTKALGKKQVDLSVGRDKHFVCNYRPMSF